MRTLIRILLALVLVVDSAAAVEAVVTQVDRSGNIVLEFDSAPPGKPAGDIELTYRASLMDMLLGRYRITAIQGRRADARAVSVNSPPSQGMRVVVTLSEPGALPVAGPDGVASEGKVVAVQGRAAEIEFPAGMLVRPGDRVTLAYEAPRVGRIAIPGIWRIETMFGRRGHAVPEGASGQPRVDQVATPLTPAAAPAAAPAPPAGQDGGKTGGLFQSAADLGTLSFDAFMAELQKQGGQGSADAMPQAAARGWLGVVLQELTPDLSLTLGLAPDASGSLVADVSAGGAAEQAGIKPGDVILEFDGEPATTGSLVAKVRQSEPGTLLRFWIWRAGSRLYLAVRVGKVP